MQSRRLIGTLSLRKSLHQMMLSLQLHRYSSLLFRHRKRFTRFLLRVQQLTLKSSSLIHQSRLTSLFSRHRRLLMQVGQQILTALLPNVQSVQARRLPHCRALSLLRICLQELLPSLSVNMMCIRLRLV